MRSGQPLVWFRAHGSASRPDVSTSPISGHTPPPVLKNPFLFLRPFVPSRGQSSPLPSLSFLPRSVRKDSSPG